MDDQGFHNMNVIPLVDVMLVLLTIVLTTSTFIAVGAVPVELPKTSTADTTPLKTKTIEIDCNGNLYLEAQPISLTALQESLGPLEKSMPILIRADNTIALQIFVDVMDVVKFLGFTKVSLQTELET
jgi:biopolymer transport protein ExbD